MSGQNKPGKVIRAATGTGATILDPDGDGFVSADDDANNATTNPGYTNKNDTSSAANELYYLPLTAYGGEVCCDLRRGPDHRFTDFVPDSKSNAVYMRFANVSGTNYMIFRMRMGSVIPGAKGFSILVDTDLKYGSNGTSADPNYVAKTTGINGNPGYELEIVLETGSRIAIYRVDGLGDPGDNISTSHALYTNTAWQDMSQVSLAATNENGDPDYFLDWYVPYSAITGITAVNSVTVPSGTSFVSGTSHQMRFMPATVMAPKPSIAGPVSDMYPDSTTIVWQAPTCMSGCVPFGTVCTGAPSVTSAIAGTGTASVTVSWTRGASSSASSTMVQIYKNGIALGAAFSVNNASTGTLSSSTIASGDLITATAISTGEQLSSSCFSSNTMPARGICATSPTTPTVSCAVRQGFEGGAYPGSSAKIRLVDLAYAASGDGETQKYYAVPGAGSGAGLLSFSGAIWTWDGGCSANGSNSGSYSVEFEDATTGCRSKPYIFCATNTQSGWQTLTTSTPTISNSTSVYTNVTSLSGTAVANSIIRIYINDFYYGTATLAGTNWSYTIPTRLVAGDVIAVRAQIADDNTNKIYYCMSVAATATVLCLVDAPFIDIDETTSKITSGNAITGRSNYPGGEVKVYNQSGDALLTTVIADSDGNWTTDATIAATGVTYYATITSGGCTSARATAQTSTTAGENTPATYCGGSIGFSTTGSGGAFTTVNEGGGIPLTSDATHLNGTLNAGNIAPINSILRVYLNGGLIATYPFGAASNSWGPIDVNGLLYQGAVLTISLSESGTKGEFVCASQTITCACRVTAKPVTPTVDPTSSSTINAGQTATIKVTNAQDGKFYSVYSRSTGISLSKGIWYTGSSDVSVVGRPLANTITFTTIPVTTTTTVVVRVSSVDGTEECTDSATRTLTVLPIVLTDFKGLRNDKSIVLNWTTAMEINFSHFEIERSSDGINFNKIGSKAGTGFLSGPNFYSFTDNTPLYGNNFYRLKMVDIDGKKEYSNVIALKGIGSSVGINSTRPNPFVTEIKISVIFMQKANIKVLVADAAGKTLLTQSFAGVAGLNELKLGDLGNLPAGIYMVSVVAGIETFRYKVLKVTQ